MLKKYSLHKAIEKGDLNSVKSLLKNKEDLETESEVLLYTPLFEAVIRGNVQIVEELLKAGANPNHSCLGNEFPLHRTGYSDSTGTIAKVLIKFSADLESQDENGDTALHVAAYYGNIDVLKVLILNNANINACNKEGYTPLHKACGYGDPETVITLIEAGAIITANNLFGQTPLHLAAGGSSIGEVQELMGQEMKKLKNINVKEETIQENFNHLETVKVLLEYSATNIGQRDDEGESAIDYARKLGRTKIVELLSSISE